MKATVSILFVLSFCFILQSCKNEIEGSGPINLHQVKIKNFDKLYLEIPAHVVVEQSDTTAFSIACQENIFNELSIQTIGKNYLFETGKRFSIQRPIEIRITCPNLKYIDLSGQGEVDYNPINYQSELKISLAGNGKVKSQINTGLIEVNINDNGDAILSGKTDLLKGTLNGPGDIHAYDLISDKGKFEIYGSGNIRCSISTSLKATIHGSGDVFYKGTPEIKSEITGSGQIKRESK